MAFFVHNCRGENYLPNKFDYKVLDRSWLINFVRLVLLQNLGNSLYSEEFGDFIEQKLYTRQSKIIKFISLSINTSPELAILLSNSKMMSSINYWIIFFFIARKGLSNLLLNRNEKLEGMANQEAEKEEKEE